MKKLEGAAPKTIGLAGTLATLVQRKRSRAVKGLQRHAAGSVPAGLGLGGEDTYLARGTAEESVGQRLAVMGNEVVKGCRLGGSFLLLRALVRCGLAQIRVAPS